jgi:hypothetical protein
MLDQPTLAQPDPERSETSNENLSGQPAAMASEQPIEEEQSGEDEGFEEEEDCSPDFIEELIRNPPLLPGESQSDFELIFESYEYGANGCPTSTSEYMLVYQATMITWQLMRLERMKVKILAYQQRPAAETVYRRTFDNLSAEGNSGDSKASARKWGLSYFADPEYRKAYAAKLEAAGYGAGAVEAEAFLRALPPLTTIDRQIGALERRLLNILKRLEACSAARDRRQSCRGVAATMKDSRRGL